MGWHSSHFFWVLRRSNMLEEVCGNLLSCLITSNHVDFFLLSARKSGVNSDESHMKFELNYIAKCTRRKKSKIGKYGRINVRH